MLIESGNSDGPGGASSGGTGPAAPALLSPPPGFMRGLMLRGASVAAVVPIAAPAPVEEEPTEPDPNPGRNESSPEPEGQSVWRTVAELGQLGRHGAGQRDGSQPAALVWDAFLAQATRYLLLGPFGYRLIAVATGEFAIWHAHGTKGFETVLGLGIALLLYQVLAIMVLLRLPRFSQRLVWPLLLGDLLISTVSNLVVAGAAPAVADQTTVELTWKCLMGTAVLWTIGRGVLAGIGIIGYGVLLQEAMLVVHSRVVGNGPVPLIANYWDNDLWLASSVASTGLGLAALVIGTRVAMTLGIRAGQQAERTRILRGVHDTVLQSLETISLRASGPAADPSRRLNEVGRIASAEAGRIRRDLDRINRAPAELVDGLAELVAEAAGSGLRVELTYTLPDDLEVPSTPRTALLAAAREAVTNVSKHAGVAHAVLSVREHDGGVQVTVRDHGVGFDPAESSGGFGTRQSIHSRLTEVGGHARIASQLGAGTRVVLWVPVG